MQDDLREAVALSMIEVLGYSLDVDWSRIYVGNGMEADGSLKALCFQLADAAIAAARPVIEREAGQYAAAVLHDLSEAKREISTLRDALVTYGDRVRMAMAASPAMQQAIDRAFDRDNLA
jgi:hypothetical protein